MGARRNQKAEIYVERFRDNPDQLTLTKDKPRDRELVPINFKLTFNAQERAVLANLIPTYPKRNKAGRIMWCTELKRIILQPKKGKP